MLKRMIALLTCMMLMVASASALEMADPLTGVCCYPEGSTEADATYVYRYAYPQVAGDSDLAVTVNDVYAYEADYIETFTTPINGEMYGEGEAQYYTNLTFDITCCTDELLSVRFLTEEYTGGEPYTKISAHVFALTGSKAGTVTSLPYLLGILDIDEDDEWLQDRQTAKADTCVRGMIWELLQDQVADGTIVFYDDVDEEFFEGCFYPEEDFYVDEDGAFVFFLQEDSVAPASYGILTFRFTMDEILDEL